MAEGGGGALREMLVSFGVHVDTKELEHFEHGLGGLLEKVKHVGHAVLGFLAVHEVEEFFLKTVESAAHVVDLSEKLGVATDELQKFQFAARLSGIDTETAAQALGMFNRQVGEALTGSKESAKNFAQFGLALRDQQGNVRPTGELILDVADKMQGLKSQQEKTALATKVFGRAGISMVPVLQQGRDAVKDLYKEVEDLGGIMGEDFLKQAKLADDELYKMKIAWQGVKTNALMAVMPWLHKFIDGMKKFAVVARDFVTRTKLIEHGLQFLKDAAIVGSIIKIVSELRKLKEAGSLLSALNPFTLMIIGGIALFAIIEDLWTMVEGGDSAFGRALGPDKAEMVETLKGLFSDLRQIWQDLKPLGKDMWEGFKEALPLVVDLMVGLLKITVGVATAIDGIVKGAKAVGEFLGNQAIRVGAAETKRLEDEGKLAPTPGFHAKTVEEMASQKAYWDQFAGPTPGSGGAATVNSSIGQVTINVEAKTNADPKSIAGEVSSALRNQTEQQKQNALNALKKR